MAPWTAILLFLLSLFTVICGQVIVPIPGYECYRCWGQVGSTKEEVLDVVKDKDLQPHHNEGCGLDFYNTTLTLKNRCTGESRCITKVYSFADYTVYVRGCSSTSDCTKQPEFAPYEYSAKCCRGNMCNVATPAVYSTNYMAAHSISLSFYILTRWLGLEH